MDNKSKTLYDHWTSEKLIAAMADYCKEWPSEVKIGVPYTIALMRAATAKIASLEAKVAKLAHKGSTPDGYLEVDVDTGIRIWNEFDR